MIIITDLIPLTHNDKIIERPYSMSFLSYRMMINLKNNPFNFQFHTNYLENLFLYGKTIDFYRIDTKNIQAYKDIIESMGDT